MTYDPTITLGNVIAIGSSLLGGGVVLVVGLYRFKQLEDRVELLWEWFKRVHGINGNRHPDDHARRY